MHRPIPPGGVFMKVISLRKWQQRALVCLMAALMHTQTFADDCGSAPIPYKANYALTRNDKPAGSMQMVLERNSADTFSYRMDTRAKWGVFRSYIHQQSAFTWKNGMLRPDRFRLTQQVSFYKRAESVDFDWETMRATGTKKRADFKLEIQPGMQDKLTIYLLLARALCDGEKSIDAEVVSGPVLKPYRYRLQAMESLDTKLGRLSTIHLRRGGPNSEKQTDLWHAAEVHFLPVKLVYRNRDKVITMNLIDISFSEANSGAEAPSAAGTQVSGSQP